MTDPTPAQALAEALHDHAYEAGDWLDGMGETTAERLAAILLTHPALAALAGQAAIGRAVERLPDGMIVISPPHDRHPDKWLVRVYDHDADEEAPEMAYGEGSTLADAIAALGEP